MTKILPAISLLLLAAPSLFAADLVTNLPMDADAFKRVKEEIGGGKLNFYGKHNPENIPGAVGDAMRFDGYSSYVEGNIPSFSPSGASSFSVWVAPETYPIVLEDQPSTEKITIAGTIDHNSKTGWQFAIDKDGNYSFDCYAGGWLASAEAIDKIPCYDWSFLAAVNDPSAGTITLYRNGNQVAQVKSLGALGNGNAKLTVGKTVDSATSPFGIKTFNGLIDEVNVYDGILSATELNATPENIADLSIPESRFENDLLRPKYHGMPAANWTNESHGLTFSDGKYHLFFQKNANGPYMSRLHWGHLTSEDLYNWTEEEIALTPGEVYDHKGCWSGCVFTDDEITGRLPNIIYTGVDYVKAYIAQAKPTDESLLDWEKVGVIINGKPAGLSDDFRDPYFFRNGDKAYIVVGTSKNGIGATTLHRYNANSGTWSNDGSIFFAGTSEAQDGTFWEMPNVTPLADGKWLFTVTPQNTSNGVHTLYWIGNIAEDGTFKPENDKPLDLELIYGQGYGLLSPTIYQKDGKTLLMGIVPDKLSTDENCNLGWAHIYSFPREISLDENGNLVQKPYSGLEDLRKDEGYIAKDFTLDGSKSVAGIGGRQFEVKVSFVVSDKPFGINLFKNTKGEATLTYTPAYNRLEINLTKLNRKVNDRNSFNGRYMAMLPETPEKGSEMTLDVYVDGSIMDIFVNDTYATSIRVYPTDSDADGVEVFSEGGAIKVNSLEGWLLGDSSYADEGNGDDNNDPDAGIDDIINDLPEYVNVYNLNGVLVKRNVQSAEAVFGLPKGIYIIGPHKVTVR